MNIRKYISRIRNFYFLVFVFSLIVFCTSGVSAQASYIIDPQNSSLQASIHYVVLKRFTASFSEYSGEIVFDPQGTDNFNADIQVDVGSLKSDYPKYDEIVRSERLLDTQQYPYVRFQSKHLNKVPEGYEVTGVLELHGVRREITVPLVIKGPQEALDGRVYLEFSGQWQIPRKDFNIVWHPVLDRGGIVVGNHIAVDWKVIAYKKE